MHDHLFESANVSWINKLFCKSWTVFNFLWYFSFHEHFLNWPNFVQFNYHFKYTNFIKSSWIFFISETFVFKIVNIFWRCEYFFKVHKHLWIIKYFIKKFIFFNFQNFFEVRNYLNFLKIKYRRKTKFQKRSPVHGQAK